MSRSDDDVVAQERFLRLCFGVESLALVVGGSMGAQQVYEWAVRFPDKVKRAAPIAGTARTTPHNALYVAALEEALTADPAWAGGWYEIGSAILHKGLQRHARLWALMGASPALLKAEGWRSLGFNSMDDFTLGFFDTTFLPMDPNDLLCMARKWRTADVGRHGGGSLQVALGRIQAKTTVMPISSDMFFVTADCAFEQALIPNSTLNVLESDWGHIGLFGVDPGQARQVDAALSALLATSV